MTTATMRRRLLAVDMSLVRLRETAHFRAAPEALRSAIIRAHMALAVVTNALQKELARPR